MHTTILIPHHTNTLHNKIFNIIRQNNFYDNYMLNKSSIITKIISADKSLKKQLKKYQYLQKKKN